MDLHNGTTALFVKDIEAAKDFYINVLHMQIDLDFGKNVIFKNGFTIWEIKDEHIIAKSIGLNKVKDTSVNRFEIYFETEDLEGTFEILKAKHVKFLHEINVEPWGQCTIRFFDPDNHLIEIGESMKQFVTRFYKQGLTVEQVSARTHVPIEEVIRLINM